MFQLALNWFTTRFGTVVVVIAHRSKIQVEKVVIKQLYILEVKKGTVERQQHNNKIKIQLH